MLKARKKRGKAVVVGLFPALKWMVMAFGTADTCSKECLSGRFGKVWRGVCDAVEVGGAGPVG